VTANRPRCGEMCSFSRNRLRYINSI